MDFTRELKVKKFPSNGPPLKVCEGIFTLPKVMCKFTIFRVNLHSFLQFYMPIMCSIGVLQCTLYTCKLCSVFRNTHCTKCGKCVHCTVYMNNALCTSKSVQCTVYNVQCTMCSVQCTVYNVQCTMYIIQYT